MAIDHLVKGRFQGARVHRSLDGNRPWQVIGMALRIELLQEPQTLLGERQRHRITPGEALDGLPGAGFIGQQQGQQVVIGKLVQLVHDRSRRRRQRK